MCIGELMFHLTLQDGMTPAARVPGQQPTPIGSETAFEVGRTPFAELVPERAPRAVPPAPGRATEREPDDPDAVPIGVVEGLEPGEAVHIARDSQTFADQSDDGIDAGLLQVGHRDTTLQTEDMASSSVPLDPVVHGTRAGIGDIPALVPMPNEMAATDLAPDPFSLDDMSGLALVADIRAVENAGPPSRVWSGQTSVLEHRFMAQTLSGLPPAVDIEATYAGFGGPGKGPDALNTPQGQSSISRFGIAIGAGLAGVEPVGAVPLQIELGGSVRGLLEGSGLRAVSVAGPTGEASSVVAMTTADPMSSGKGSGRAAVATQAYHSLFPAGNVATDPGLRRNDLGSSAVLNTSVPETTSFIGTILPVAVPAKVHGSKTTLSGMSSALARGPVSAPQRSGAGAESVLRNALLSPTSHQEVSTEDIAHPLATTATGTSTTSPASAPPPVALPPLKTAAESALQRMSLAKVPVDGAEVLLMAEEVGEPGFDLGRLDIASGIGRGPVAYGTNATMSPAQGAATQIALAVANGNGARTNVVLDPEELGRVRLNMVTDEQSITMFVMAERPETLELLRRNIDILAQEFRELGFSNVTFAFGEGGTSENPTNGQSSNTSADSVDVAATSRESDQRSITRGPDGHLDIRL